MLLYKLMFHSLNNLRLRIKKSKRTIKISLKNKKLQNKFINKNLKEI